MEKIGIHEAKVHFSKLIDRVDKGEEFIITRRGVPVARIKPVKNNDQEKIKKAIEKCRELRKGVTLDGLSIRELIEEGRRY
ncbi:MAG: type II toxin-antitoxin system Phd/YefM family antitoxin [bacterium]|jgi:prevent-host-death family protein